jgi:hypothetical protein
MRASTLWFSLSAAVVGCGIALPSQEPTGEPQAVDASSGMGSSSSGASGEAASLSGAPSDVDASTVDAGTDTMVSSTSSSGVTCIPRTDLCVGKCGNLANNGCDAPVSCPQCTGRSQCNTMTNVCECTPETATKACGNQCSNRAPDGCGGFVACTPAVCDPVTERCLSKSGPDRCCTKATKANVCRGDACGKKSDGCGGTVDCGTACPGADVCCKDFAGPGSGQCGPKSVLCIEIQ